MLEIPDKGTRIRLTEMSMDPAPIEVGAEGTVMGGGVFEDWVQIWVRWDSGRSLALCCPQDKFEVIDDATDALRKATIIDMAINEYVRDGEIEIDTDTVVSEGDDNGAYIQAWVWVSFADTPLDKMVEEDETDSEVIEES